MYLDTRNINNFIEEYCSIWYDTKLIFLELIGKIESIDLRFFTLFFYGVDEDDVICYSIDKRYAYIKNENDVSIFWVIIKLIFFFMFYPIYFSMRIIVICVFPLVILFNIKLKRGSQNE